MTRHRAVYRIRIHARGCDRAFAGRRHRFLMRERAWMVMPWRTPSPLGRRSASAVGPQSVCDDEGGRGSRFYRASRRRAPPSWREDASATFYLVRWRRRRLFRLAHQYRSLARAVRQHPGDGRPDPAGDCLQRHHHAFGVGRDLSPAGDRERHPVFPQGAAPALAHLAFLALVVINPSMGLCARHLAGGRADDPPWLASRVLVALSPAGSASRPAIFPPCRLVLSFQTKVLSACDHSGGGDAVHRLRVVRSAAACSADVSCRHLSVA